MNIEILILNFIFVSYLLILYFKRNQPNFNARMFLITRVMMYIFIPILVFEMVYFSVQIFIYSQEIRYFTEMMNFLNAIIFCIFSFYLYLQINPEMQINLREKSYKKITLLQLFYMIFMYITIVIRYYQVLNGSPFPPIIEGEIDIIQTVLFFVIDVVIAVVFIVVAILFKKEKINRKTALIVVVSSLILITFEIVFSLFSGNIQFGKLFSGDIFSGVGFFDDSAEVISQIFYSIIQSPQIQISIVFMLFGAFARVFPSQSPYFKYIGNVLIVIIPLMIWLLIFSGTIPTPISILALFSNFEFFGHIFYLILVGVIFTIVSVTIGLFTSIAIDLF